VAEVYEDAEPVHLLDECYAEVAEPGVAALPAAVPRRATVVVGELDDPDAVVIRYLEEVECAFKEAAVLGSEYDAVSGVLLGFRYVRGGFDDERLVLAAFSPRVLALKLP